MGKGIRCGRRSFCTRKIKLQARGGEQTESLISILFFCTACPGTCYVSTGANWKRRRKESGIDSQASDLSVICSLRSVLS